MWMRRHDLERAAQVDDLAAEGDAAHAGQQTHLLSPCLHELYADLRNSSRHSANLTVLRLERGRLLRFAPLQPRVVPP